MKKIIFSFIRTRDLRRDVFMTAKQKKQIELLRKSGYSYSVIAEGLDVSENTVKSYFRRSKPLDRSVSETQCPQCNKPVTQNPKRKQKRFCSDECRFTWWKVNREAMNKKAVYILVCEGCGREFESYGNKNRKYCAIDCYMTARFKTEPMR